MSQARELLERREREAAKVVVRVTREDEERLDWYLSSYQAEGA